MCCSKNLNKRKKAIQSCIKKVHYKSKGKQGSERDKEILNKKIRDKNLDKKAA